MSKNIKCVNELVKRAYNNPGRTYTYGKIKGTNRYKYEAKYSDEGLKLWHYDTLILLVTRHDIFLGRGAYSVSDRDAINTVLQHSRIPCFTKGYARILKGELELIREEGNGNV